VPPRATDLHIDEPPVVEEAAVSSGRRASIGVAVAVADPARSTKSSGRRRCWRKPMCDGVGGGRGGAVDVPVRSGRIPQRMSSLDIQRVDYEKERRGEKRDGGTCNRQRTT
jgi:hypothetical protein